MSQLNAEHAARLIREGKLVAFPTETVYGLGADATNASAIAKIYQAKGRPRFNPLISHMHNTDAARKVASFSAVAERLAEAFWPGPLAIVLPRKDLVCDLTTAGLPTAAVRVPDHTIALEFLEACGVPVAAPSANLSGYVSPTSAEHVREQFGDQVAGVLDGGECRVGLESTVVRATAVDGSVEILRSGAITLEDLHGVLGKADVRKGEALHEAPDSPGQLKVHYATRTPLRLVDDWHLLNMSEVSGKRVAVLKLSTKVGEAEFPKDWMVESLSSTGDLVEAASKLFAVMRSVDAAGVDVILAESVPEEGIGVAIMDRLRRAAARGE